MAQANGSAGFTLPPLPYAYNALEPFIDTATMELHHQRHHGAAVNNLNNALKDYPELRQREISDLLANISQLPEAVRGGVRNAGGSHLNHMIYWATMGPGGGGQPNGALAQAIGSTFGSFDAFKQQLTDLSLRIFGSGWGWLALDRSGKLQLISRPNQDAPVMDGFNVIVGIDMWEHAHYLKYQHRRADYVAAWFNVINWESVGKRFDAANQAL
ncbi:MAG: superoxide dismutase [Chloroflexaceae bacterium]|nr:superoxide dismutase [Chloroflexaceae bacterium]